MNTKPVVVGGLLISIVGIVLVARQLLVAKANESVEPRLDPQSLTERPVDAPVSQSSPASGSTYEGSSEAAEVVNKLIQALKEKRSDLAEECFGVERIGAGTVSELIKAWEPYGEKFQIEGSRQVSDETVEVFTPQETVGPEKGSRVVFVIGKKADGWKIVNVTFPKS